MPSQSNASSVFSVKPCFKFHGANYITQRGNITRPKGEFLFELQNVLLSPMNPVEETRRVRLRMLVKQHESMANLCQTLGYARTETATLTRIMNANVRHDRDGKPYNMGSPMARQIEEKLSLGVGWMDTPPTYAELDGDDRQAQMLLAMESIPADLWPTARRLLDALSKPEAKNGTTGG